MNLGINEVPEVPALFGLNYISHHYSITIVSVLKHYHVYRDAMATPQRRGKPLPAYCATSNDQVLRSSLLTASVLAANAISSDSLSMASFSTDALTALPIDSLPSNKLLRTRSGNSQSTTSAPGSLLSTDSQTTDSRSIIPACTNCRLLLSITEDKLKTEDRFYRYCKACRDKRNASNKRSANQALEAQDLANVEKVKLEPTDDSHGNVEVEDPVLLDRECSVCVETCNRGEFVKLEACLHESDTCCTYFLGWLDQQIKGTTWEQLHTLLMAATPIFFTAMSSHMHL